MNAVHVTKLIFVCRGVHVAVEQALQHLQEGVVILGDFTVVLRLESQRNGRTLTTRRLVLLLLGRQDLRPLVHVPETFAEDGVQSHEVIPVAVGEEQGVCLVLKRWSVKNGTKMFFGELLMVRKPWRY